MMRSVTTWSASTSAQIDAVATSLKELLVAEVGGGQISDAVVEKGERTLSVIFTAADERASANLLGLLVSAGQKADPTFSLASMAQIAPADLYRTAVEEYRFQATHNWNRTQYLLALNAGILVAAVGTAAVVPWLPALVFALGCVTSLATIGVVRVQHDYYRSARDRMRTVEQSTRVDPSALITTTKSLGGRPRRFSVNQVIYVVLGAMAVANAAGVVLTFFGLG